MEIVTRALQNKLGKHQEWSTSGSTHSLTFILGNSKEHHGKVYIQTKHSVSSHLALQRP